ASTKSPHMPRLWCLHSRPRADIRSVKVPRPFGGRTHLTRRPHELVAFIALGAALSAAAVIGVSWAAGFGAVADRLRHVDANWLPLALAAEVLAYVGYVLAYRDVHRRDSAPPRPRPPARDRADDAVGDRRPHRGRARAFCPAAPGPAPRWPRLARPPRAMARLDPRDPPAFRQARARCRADRNGRLLVRRHRLPRLLPARLRGPLSLDRAAAARLCDPLCLHTPGPTSGRSGRGPGSAS